MTARFLRIRDICAVVDRAYSNFFDRHVFSEALPATFRLGGYLHMHLKPETALNLLDRRLDADDELFWKKHVQNCDKCTEDLERWRELRSGLKRSHLRSAPSQDIENVIRLFRAAPRTSGSTLRRVLASIVFDSFLQPALAGARGAGVDSRQLVLKSEILDIHLKVWGERDHKQM